MGTKKKNNTAIKEEQDFAADILAEELQGVLKSVPDQNADDFFNSLKEEMLGEGVVLESSIAQSAPIQEFTDIDIVPELLQVEDEAQDGVALDKEQTSAEFTVENDEPKITENSLEQPLEEEISQEEVEAAVDEIFGKNLDSIDDQEEVTNPIRVFEDKTAAMPNFPDVTEMLQEDKTQDLSSLENVTAMESAKAATLHQVVKRNPSIDLKNADYIKFAQDKIKNLEKDLANLRIENQELALAGSHFKALADEREQRNKNLEAKISELQSTSIEEKKILNTALEAKETKISLLQERVESLEVELESKYNRLRVRERELESRLEILKQEQDAVASSKDDLILRVKKQNNSLTADLERARAQSQKHSGLLQEKEDALRRTIKALKLSLTMLESQKQN